jgi:transcriptional regulator with XRE-family HTH domain
MHVRIGEDIRRMRTDASVSMSALATIAGIDRAHLARIEAGQANPSLDVLVSIGIGLGADLGVRYFDGAGPMIHDRFQAPMGEALLAAVDPRWHVRLEVPVSQPTRGVIDLVLSDPTTTTVIAGEIQSELRRLEQQIRWSAEKAKALGRELASTDSAQGSLAVSRLLVLRSTVATRELARQFETTLAAAYPARTADVVEALTSPNVRWPGDGIVWMHLEGRDCTLMPYPPPRVTLGR